MGTLTDKLGFEIETCSRCCGTGEYSYCESYGKKCFKCHGTGHTYTKRGKMARDRFEAAMTVPASSVKVGDNIRVESITMGGSAFRYFATVTAISDVKESGRSRVGNGEWVTHYGFDITTENEKFGTLTMGVTHERMIRKCMTAEEKQPLIQEALAYQARLTKAGTEKKRGA